MPLAATIMWDHSKNIYTSTHSMHSFEQAEYNFLATVVNEIISLSLKNNIDFQWTVQEVVKSLSSNDSRAAMILLQDISIFWALE